MTGPGPRPIRLETLFDTLPDRTDDGRHVRVGDIFSALSHRSFGPLLLLPALISVLPVIGALPGVTWTTAALCLIVSLHFLLQRHALWLPAPIRRLKASRSAFDKGLAAARPWLRRLDGITHPRFRILMRPPAAFLIAALCVILSLAMFVFSIVPGGVVIPAAGLILLAIGLTTHDGLFLALGVAVGAASLAGAIWLILRFVS